MTELKIGALARLTRTNAPTIRYYESIGLLPPALRNEGGQRAFDDRDVQRLTFIRSCRELGFPLEQVRAMADVLQDSGRSCGEVRDLASVQLLAVRAKKAELAALEKELNTLVENCSAECLGGPPQACVISVALLRHRNCQ